MTSETCDNCDGTGEEYAYGRGPSGGWAECQTCEGTGHVLLCEACRLPAHRTDYVSDPDTLALGEYGLVLCDRSQCEDNRDRLTPDQRIALYSGG